MSSILDSMVHGNVFCVTGSVINVVLIGSVDKTYIAKI